MSASELWIYLGFFVTLVAAGLGLPAPEELVITGAGALAGRLPPDPKTVVVPVVYPTPTEVVGALAVNPHGGFPGGLPWAALVRSAAPRELSGEEVGGLGITGLLAVNPHGGFPAALPWPALAGAGPPFEQRVVPPDDDGVHVRWWIMLPVCVLGVVLSDIILFSLGWWGGDRLMKYRWMARMLPPHRRQRTEENFHRYGVSILVFGRLVPGIRAPLFLTAGSMRLPLPRFLMADGLGAVVGNSFFFFLGYWLGDSVKTLIERAEARAKPIVIIAAVGSVVAYLLWHFLRHPVSTGDPKEVPLIGPQVASHIEHAEHPAAGADGKPAGPKPSTWKKLSLLLLVLAGGAASVLIYRWKGRRGGDV